jgi:hypothetical protein
LAAGVEIACLETACVQTDGFEIVCLEDARIQTAGMEIACLQLARVRVDTGGTALLLLHCYSTRHCNDRSRYS